MIGRQISHFYLIRTLGMGGMGIVYEAQDTRLPRSVAIKVLREDLAKNVEAVRRFKREARLASSLNHPNICTILEVGEGESQSFIAMEFLEGTSLKSRLLGDPIALNQIVDTATQVAHALGAAHAQGIVHRDISPGNIFLSTTGLVKLLDFGLAKHFPVSAGDAGATEDLTNIGTVAGTIHYMSPEQLAGRKADYRCDLFALGVVLYQMATGARPFDLQPRSALSLAIQRQPHIPIRQLAPHHPVQLERIIDLLLAKDPDQRYQSADGLAADLAALSRLTGLVWIEPPAMGSSSVVVLPFDVVGGEGDVAAATFRDGLEVELASRLSQLPDVSVAPRTSTRALNGLAVREIAQRLGVALVLEGTLQKSADRVRVTASLVDAADERQVVPTIVIEQPWRDALTTQDAIASQVCDRLRAVVSRIPARRYSQDPDAYLAFKRGQHLWKSCFEGGWRPSIEHFQHAIDRDPHFAVAHVALANAYNFLGFYSLIKPSQAFAVAARSAERALAIDRTLAAGFVELALARFGGDWDWEGAEQAFRRSVALDATNPLAHVFYSWLLMILGREDAALVEAHRGHALAPSSRLLAGARAQTLYLGARYDEAIELCTECLRFDPNYVFAVQVRGLCFLARSMRDQAVADLDRAVTLSHRAPFYLGLLGHCYGQFGMRDEALALVTELQNQSSDTYVPPQSFVFIYAGLGERERAFAHQERAYEDGASPFNYLTPYVRALYAQSPHHKKRLEQMRLVL